MRIFFVHVRSFWFMCVFFGSCAYLFVQVMMSTEHFMATDIEWDPTGRYVASCVSWWGHKVCIGVCVCVCVCMCVCVFIYMIIFHSIILF